MLWAVQFWPLTLWASGGEGYPGVSCTPYRMLKTMTQMWKPILSALFFSVTDALPERQYGRLWVWTAMKAGGRVLRHNVRTLPSPGVDGDIHVRLLKAALPTADPCRPADSCDKNRCGDTGNWQPPQPRDGWAARKAGQRLTRGRGEGRRASVAPVVRFPVLPPNLPGLPVGAGHVPSAARMLLHPSPFLHPLHALSPGARLGGNQTEGKD